MHLGGSGLYGPPGGLKRPLVWEVYRISLPACRKVPLKITFGRSTEHPRTVVQDHPRMLRHWMIVIMVIGKFPCVKYLTVIDAGQWHVNSAEWSSRIAHSLT